MKNPFRHSFKKHCAGILAAAMTAGTIFAGAAGVQAAARDKVLPVPIDFIGATGRFDNSWQSASRFHVNGGSNVNPLADHYTYSCTYYIPQAVFGNPGSTVWLNSWCDVQVPSQEEGGDDQWIGNLHPRYNICLVNEKGKVQFGLWDCENDWQRVEDPAAYAGFLSLGTAGDFYKVTIKDAPLQSVIYGEEDAELEIDTSVNGYLNINFNITGESNKITSVVYLDDISLKSDSVTWLETDGSGESLENINYYEYVIAEDDNTCVERPASIDLNTSLLSLAKASGSVKAGKTVSIKATAAASGTITYKSSNKKVATVNAKGKVKGVKAGTAKITVSANGVSRTYTVKVSK